jgi:hypothetical protein
MKAFQYTAHCRTCFVTRALVRAQVETGRNPVCDGCGADMVVYSGAGDVMPAGNQEQRMRAVEGS